MPSADDPPPSGVDDGSLPPPEPKEIDTQIELQLRHLIEDSILRGMPNGDEKCVDCLYYLNPDNRLSYCWHPKLRILVGDVWWCQWYERRES